MKLTQHMLDNVNIAQAMEQNKEYLESALGGIDGFVQLCGSNIKSGLSSDQVKKMREHFGQNIFPQAPMEGFFSLLFEAFQDTTLMILIAAACVSLALGIIEHGAESGWTEGAAILIAVFLVANVSAGNDYTKELQFRALENSSQADERASVIRDGVIERINPSELVVGDIIILQVITVLFN